MYRRLQPHLQCAKVAFAGSLIFFQIFLIFFHAECRYDDPKREMFELPGAQAGTKVSLIQHYKGNNGVSNMGT